MDFLLQKLSYAGIYAALAGLYLLGTGIMEITRPLTVSGLWERFIQSRLFPAYGVLLTLLALPLTLYRGYFSWFILIMGALAAITGPVILLFPGFIQKNMMAMTRNEEGEDLLPGVVRMDGILRIVLGLIFLTGVSLTLSLS